MIRRPPRSTPFPTRRSSDLLDLRPTGRSDNRAKNECDGGEREPGARRKLQMFAGEVGKLMCELAYGLPHGPIERPYDQNSNRDDHGPLHPGKPVNFIRQEQIALEDLAEHKAQYHWRAGPAQTLHNPADDAEAEEEVEIAPAPRRLEGGDHHDRHDQRQKRLMAHLGETRELARTKK